MDEALVAVRKQMKDELEIQRTDQLLGLLRLGRRRHKEAHRMPEIPGH